MLKLFCVTTILLSVYLLFGFFGYYQKWFDGPAGITQQTMYWLIRLGIGILVEALIFLDRYYYGLSYIGTARHPLESSWNRVWVDPNPSSDHASYYYQNRW